MARSASRRAESRGEGRVVMVSQQSDTKKKKDSKSRSGSKSVIDEDKKKIPIASRMWDSFESDSASEEEEDEAEDDKAPSTRRGSTNSTTSASLQSHGHGRDDRARSARKAKTVVVRKSDGKIRSSGDEDGSQGAGSSSRNAQPRFAKGDSVLVYLESGGKAKGTISNRPSSGGRYDVTLENGDVEKRVSPRDISLAPRRGGRDPAPERSSGRSRKDTQRRRKSRGSDSDRRGQEKEKSTLRRRRSSRASDASPGLAQGLGTNQPVDRPVSPVPSEPLPASVSDGGETAPQPPEAGENTPDIAPVTEAPTPPSSGSELDTGPGESESSPQEDASPLKRNVRRAQGLLKTMFRRNGEGRRGEEGRRSSRRRWSSADSVSRRFSADSGDHGDTTTSAASAPPSGDDSAAENKKETIAQTAATQNTQGSAVADVNPPLQVTPSDAVSSLAGDTTAAAEGTGRRFSRGLTRGRSRSRKEGNNARAPGTPETRSPSIVTKLGMSLRGAIMGKTHLGVHQHNAELWAGEGEPDAGPEGGGSEATYSTDASATRKERPGRRLTRRRSSGPAGKHQQGTVDRTRGEMRPGNSSDGFDSGMFSPDSPLAPASLGDPRNLPEAVSSYIGTRERMEQDMGATGPVFLPRSGNLLGAPGPGEGKRRGSLDITKQAASTTQLSERHQPFTEAMFKAGVSETKHSTKQGILLEGDLQKFSPESMRGVRWHKRYFVLYAGACELRYYRTHVEAAWGRIPLGERGSIPLRLVVKIEQPSDKKYRGCRFDLVVLHRGEGRHPGLQIRPGQEQKILTTKTFKFNAADAQQRLLWVTVIEALMNKHGWGQDTHRRRGSRAPRHGGPGGPGTGDSLLGTWGGGEEAGASGDVPQSDTSWLGDGHQETLDGEEGLAASSGADLRRGVGAEAGSRKQGSVLTFIEDDVFDPQQGDPLCALGGAPAAPQRGIHIPYSPQGRRGSLTTAALSPPAPSSWGANRRQSSLRSDLLF